MIDDFISDDNFTPRTIDDVIAESSLPPFDDDNLAVDNKKSAMIESVPKHNKDDSPPPALFNGTSNFTGTAANCQGKEDSMKNNSQDSWLTGYQARFKPTVTDDDISAIQALPKDEQNKLKEQLLKTDWTATPLFEKAKIGGICPICGNGSGRDGDGIKPKIYRDSYVYKCFVCNHFTFTKKDGTPKENCNFLEFIAVMNDIHNLQGKNFLRVLAIGKKIIDKTFNGKFDVLAITETFKDRQNSTNNEKKAEKIKFDIKSGQHIFNDCYDWQRYELFKTSRLINSELVTDRIRGLTIETLKKFGVGFIPGWIHPTSPITTPAKPCWIIPTSENHYTAITVKYPTQYRANCDADKSKFGGKIEHAGSIELLTNIKHKDFGQLIKRRDVALITEGEFDVISIAQATNFEYGVIGGGGTSSNNKIVDFLNAAVPTDQRNTFTPIIIADNDIKETGENSGIKFATDLVTLLKQNGYPAIYYLLDDSATVKVDSNDFLIKFGDDALKSRLEEIISDAQSKLPQLQAELKAEKTAANNNNSPAENSATPNAANAQTSTGDNLKNQLRDVKQKLEEFEKEKSTAIETLKNVENFDNKTVFSDEIINAAAFAKKFDLQTYSVFYRDLKSFGDKHRAEKVNLNDFTRLVNNTAELITDRQNKLKAEFVSINAKIATENFIADNPELKNITIPNGYYFSLSDGVTKIVDDKGNTAQVCNAPIIIARKTKNIETKTFKLILQFWTRDGRKITLPAMPASSIFNARKIIDLADYGLPINSLLAFRLTEFLDSYKFQNENLIPTTCIAPRCGWYNFNGSDIFLDPRRNSTITDDGTDCPLIVDSQSTFAQSLTTKGTLENWIRAYNLAKSSPIARLTVAAAVAPPLLKVLGERNFLLYVYGQTRSGKSTAMNLGASAVGDENMIRNFDGTKNGLIGAAADVSDYAFFVDEKQSADNRLQDSMALLIYSWSNGVGRTKLNKDSSLKKLANWRTIAVANGETPLFSDNVTGGAYTRALQLHAPNTILDADTCKQIRDIIKDNYGLVMPLFIEKIFEYGKDFLREQYKIITDSFAKVYPDVLAEYTRYIAVITLADSILNICLGVNEETADNDALNNARAIFKLTPTTTDIDDTTRETDSIFGFIAQNQSRFIGGNVELEKMQMIYGRIENTCIYITVAAMKQACTDGGFNYDKVVNDLIAANIIIPSDKIEKKCKTPLNTHLKKLATSPARCFKLIKPNRFLETD